MDTPSPSTGPTAKALLRRRRTLAATVVLAIAASLVLAFSPASPGAGAEPKRCDDGTLPPCPPEPPDPTSPSTLPEPQWTATVNIADASNGLGFRRDSSGSWARAGQPHHVTPSSPVVWSDAVQTQGSVTLADPSTICLRATSGASTCTSRACRGRCAGAGPTTRCRPPGVGPTSWPPRRPPPRPTSTGWPPTWSGRCPASRTPTSGSRRPRSRSWAGGCR